MDKNKTLAQDVLQKIGGKENIISVFHCATRLRFELQDQTKVNEEELKKVNGVLGIKKAGTSFQVIIGPNVSLVYDELCNMAELDKKDEIKENLDDVKEKRKFSFKWLFDVVITYIMNSVAPIIPILIGASIWKTVETLLGPDMFNVISNKSDFFITCNFFFEALFYFFPLYIGYTAAKQLKVNPMWGIFLGAMIITPSFMALVGVRESISFFGINVPVSNYSQQFLPVLIGVWIFKYVNKFLTKYTPTMIASLIVPILNVMIMAIVMFVFCAPLGSYLSQLLSDFFMYCANAAAPIRIIALTIYTALNPFMILFGLHVTTYVAAVTAAAPIGFEAFVLPAGVITSFIIYGMALGAAFKFKKNKDIPMGYFVSGFVAGITEPSLYGVCLKSKTSILVLVICNAIGGLLLAVFNIKCALMASVNILSVVPYFSVGSTFNVVAGTIIALGCCLMAALGVNFFAKFDEQ